MSDEIEAQLGSFSPTVARDALRKLRLSGRGSLLVTSGQADVRLVVNPQGFDLEAAGLELVGGDENDIMRAFLCSLFWEEPSYFLEPRGEPLRSALAIRTKAEAYSVLNQLDKGVQELRALREQVPSMDLLVSVSGEPPPEDVDTPSANLFRVLSRSPRGAHLGSAAAEAGLDTLDAAWAVFDLLEAGQAEVKSPPASLAIRRIRFAEPMADEGLSSGVRYAHLARGFARSDPRRAAQYCISSGEAFLEASLPDQALQAYETCLNFDSDNVIAHEGLVRALETMQRQSDAAKLREQLIKRYFAWHMPQRARRHLEALGKPTTEFRELLLNAQLQLKDFAAAAEYAQRNFPDLTGPQRLALAESFASFGARGAELEPMVEFAGVHALRPVKRVLKGLALVVLLGLAVLGGEIALRLKFQEAARRTRAHLLAGEMDALQTPWQQLSELAGTIPHAGLSVLARVPQLQAELKNIQDDHAMMRDPALRTRLTWNRADKDTRDAIRELSELEASAASAALRVLVARTRDELKAYRDAVKQSADDFKDIANRKKILWEAQRLLADHANAKDLFRHLEVPVLIGVTPVESTLDWGPLGRRARFKKPMRPGTWLVKLPVVEGSYGTLSVSTPAGGYVTQRHEIHLDQLTNPEVEIELFQVVPGEGRPEDKPDAAQRAGLHVVDVFGGRDRLERAVNDPLIEPSAPALAALEKLLTPQQLLIVRVSCQARFGKQVYLERIELWLDHAISGKSAGPWEVRLEREAAARFGLSRPYTEEGRFIVRDISHCPRFDRVLEALEYAVKQLQKGLK